LTASPSPRPEVRQHKLTAFTGNIKHIRHRYRHQMSTIDFTWKLAQSSGWHRLLLGRFPGTSGTLEPRCSFGRQIFQKLDGADIFVKWKLGNLTLLGDYVASKLNGVGRRAVQSESLVGPVDKWNRPRGPVCLLPHVFPAS
jgi:hypothetical protein